MEDDQGARFLISIPSKFEPTENQFRDESVFRSQDGEVLRVAIASKAQPGLLKLTESNIRETAALQKVELGQGAVAVWRRIPAAEPGENDLYSSIWFRPPAVLSVAWESPNDESVSIVSVIKSVRLDDDIQSVEVAEKLIGQPVTAIKVGRS